MSKSSRKFLEVREEQEWIEQVQQARREFDYLDKRLKDRNVKPSTVATRHKSK